MDESGRRILNAETTERAREAGMKKSRTDNQLGRDWISSSKVPCEDQDFPEETLISDSTKREILGGSLPGKMEKKL